MACKRSASTDLNHDNWNQEEAPEEAGTFAKATEDILEKRVLKAARRRLTNMGGETGKSAFGSFAGFKTNATSSTSSPFSFLTNANSNTKTISSINSNTLASKDMVNSNGVPNVLENGISDENSKKSPSPSKKPANTNKTEDNSKDKKASSHSSSAYYAKLKGLNESVTQWIKKHVDSNPYCILTPIFKDYEKYLKEIEEKEERERKKTDSEENSSPKASKKQAAAGPVEKKIESSIFGNAKTTSSSTSNLDSWKPEKSIFGNVNNSAKSVFGNTEQKPETLNNLFSTCGEKNPFFNKVSSSTSEEKQSETSKPETKSPTISFSQTAVVNPATFSFGQSSTGTATAGFSFGSGKPFSFGAQVVKPETDEKTENKEEDDDDEPPKVEFKPVTEEGSIYEQRCKVFVKKGSQYGDRGVGTLFLKPTPNDKMQLIVRGVNSLGNLLLNTLLTSSTPIKRMKDNTIMIICLPMPDSQPPPTSVLLRVKTKEDGDTLLEALEKHQK